jgi:hypothetical protein
MESTHNPPERLAAEVACAAVLALLIEARDARSPGPHGESVEALLARAGLSSREIGLATGQSADTVDARLNADGPALWRTLQGRRAAMANTTRASSAPQRPA